MKWLTFEIQRAPGFRFNAIDALLILVIVSLSYGLWVGMPDTTLWGVPLYVGGTFFLFCNVFRIGNRIEPLWYLPFAAVMVYALMTFDFSRFWRVVWWGLEPWKWVLIVYAMRSARYHGAGYRWINPGLDESTR